MAMITLSFLLVIIGKVYAVKQQAATATRLAALAGTSVMLETTLRGVEKFDDFPDPLHPDPLAQKLADGKSVKALLNERAAELQHSGQAKDIAYVNAMNEILSPRISAYGLLSRLIRHEIDASESVFTDAVRQVLVANDGNLERSTVTLTGPDYRVEVIADVTYESITDSAQSYMPDFVKDIPQKGYGPSMKYLNSIY